VSLVILLALIAVVFLAFSNGANDNFKGVATLLGSKTTSYKVALAWATITTFAGSCAAFFLAQKLMVNFSGKGLVPNEVVQLASFSVSVALAAATTVFLATKFGFPISTTHALTGALVGAGFVASATGVNVSQLLTAFFIPLLLSPFISIAGAIILYPLFNKLKLKMGVQRESCLCIGKEIIATSSQGFSKGTSAAAMIHIQNMPTMALGTKVTCEERYTGQVWGINAKSILDLSHFISSGLVSFARGLNDTPKIAAILLVAGSLNAAPSIAVVGIVMALGGLIMAKKIANTMSYQITEMNDGQGFTANLITSTVVLGASHFGMPVSTTHVSCGALFGIGTVTHQAHWKSILKIVMSWVVTLPLAATLGCLIFLLLKNFI
jgi:inorganic phosphate transporter, PiT family